ncbi:MAG: DNA replication and repair protein RecF [Bacteroidales bacterium]|nr:DNA replication and repair protein RecF [Bacteroidales bacterium]
MYLHRISILNFKNISEASVEFSPKLNCFFGKNGQGKTNLLDAIYLLSFCKSHHLAIDSQAINHQADFYMVQGNYLIDNKEREFYCGVKRRGRKVFKHDKKAYEKLSEHIGQIPLVMISPADEALIREGSEERRRFMDMAISQYDNTYMQALVAYNNALQQRNAMLKDESRSYPDDMYEVYEYQMARHASDIYRKRKGFIEAFTPVFNRFHQEISNSREKVSLSYSSHLEKGDLATLMAEVRERDKILGYSTRGIHKDDIDILLDDYALKRIGSQGQNKTCLIAMKLAQADFLRQQSHHAPILLLDDLFDKLDENRVESIIKLVLQPRFGQIFITDTQYSHLQDILEAAAALTPLEAGSEHRLFYVENGQVASAAQTSADASGALPATPGTERTVDA